MRLRRKLRRVQLRLLSLRVSAMSNVKQEHTTNLSGPELVSKTHPIIELRGRLDELNARIVLLQIRARAEEEFQLEAELEEVRGKAAELITCEVRGTPCGELTLWGMSEAEIHERSHYPDRYYALGHILPHADMGRWAAEINLLRTLVREVELVACRAFDDGEGGVTRPDIVKVLNRLSSAFYILIYKYLPEQFDHVVHFGKKVR